MTRSFIRAITTREDLPIVTGFIPARELTERAEMSPRDHKAGTGYQREPSPKRISELVTDLANGSVSLPTAVLLNVRDFDGSQLIEQRDGRTCLRLRRERLYVVDGQHRVCALAELVAQDSETWGSYSVPFVALLGADEDEEMWQFYLVNNNAHSVKVDLAYDILKQRSDRDKAFRAAVKTRDQWKIEGQALAEVLAKQPLWRDRIQFPAPQKQDGTTIRSGSFVTSLRPVLRDRAFQLLSPDEQSSAVHAYWRAIQDALPEVFEEPTGYLMQRTVGVHAMHTFFLDVFVRVQASHGSITEVASYGALLTPALNGLHDQTPDGQTVKGADFWRKGRAGAAGRYSSGAGHKAIADKLRELLPGVIIA